jgi:hypothetical protein
MPIRSPSSNVSDMASDDVDRFPPCWCCCTRKKDKEKKEKQLFVNHNAVTRLLQFRFLQFDNVLIHSSISASISTIHGDLVAIANTKHRWRHVDVDYCFLPFIVATATNTTNATTTSTITEIVLFHCRWNLCGKYCSGRD